ncbi:MAG TPA: PRC-barrel domain-containing protein, partial [Nitrolancea sp.]|nr:PRC-barrel domain-containing protein [Nitrolancea sp.]
MGEEGVVSYGPNSSQEIEGAPPETVRDEEQDLRNMIHHGMEVYDGEQKKVGKISAVSEPLDAAGHFYITVERGFLGLGHDIYIPSQYLSVWDDRAGVEVSKGHIDTMGWEQPPDQEASPQSGPPETYAETAPMAPPATQETPERRESNKLRIQ